MTASTFSLMTDAQAKILARMAEGKSNKEIARDLKITDATVKVHVRTILRITGAGNRTEAALWAHGAWPMNDEARRSVNENIRKLTKGCRRCSAL